MAEPPAFLRRRRGSHAPHSNRSRPAAFAHPPRGDAERVDLDAIEIPEPAKDEALLQLNDALDELQAVSPERAEIVKLRFFAGFSETEIASLLNISERSVQRHWSCAKAWLFERIQEIEN
jgi:RNA polymerase sigma factor (sigma-70 family)